MLENPPKFEGFDRKSCPRPFKIMFTRSDFFVSLLNEAVWIVLTCYGINSKITKLELF